MNLPGVSSRLMIPLIILLFLLYVSYDTWFAVDLPRPQKPNVVLILADDLGWQDVGAYDIDEPTPFETPNIDELATQGVKFWQAYSPAPSCTPSRGAILAGKYPARLQKTHVVGGHPPVPYNKTNDRMIAPWMSGRLPVKEVTIARALKTNGYTTGHAGKWHVAINHNAYPQPEDHGFDFSRHSRGVTHGQKPDRLSEFATSNEKDPFRLDKNGYPFHQNNADALDFIGQSKHQPFFLYYATWLVHTPIHTRNQRLLQKYSDKMGVPYPEGPEPWNIPGQKNPYYGSMVESLDYYIGQILGYLEETDDPRWPGHKLVDNTYIIFNSDNGGYIRAGKEQITTNTPLRKGKSYAEEGGVRVPLIIKGPAIPKGIETNVMVNGIDIYPTILSWTGTTPHPSHHLDGVDLSTLLATDPVDPLLLVDQKGDVRDTMVWHFPHPVSFKSTIREGDFKLIRNWDHVGNPRKKPFELYRLYQTQGREQIRLDIEELNNLAAVMPDKVKTLDALLEKSLQGMNARYPYYNPNYKRALKNKKKVCVVGDHGRSNHKVWLEFQPQGARVIRAQLIYTNNGGDRYEEWYHSPATLVDGFKVVADLPEDATHYVFNLIDENNFLVSFPDMGEIRQRREAYSVNAIRVDQ